MQYEYLKFRLNNSKGVQVMETINMQCKSTSEIHQAACFMLKVVCLVARAYIGEVLIQIWLKSVQK